MGESNRAKLGLALSGGGLRASFFHLGVFRRLAELDLLRHVEVLSTVSGGSIIGALYVLLLKLRLDANAYLEPVVYREIVDELQRLMVRGAQQNLRTRLFLNPLGFLRVMVTHWTLAQRMGRLYERYLYAEPVARIQGRPGPIRLCDVRFRPGGQPIAEGLEAYNAAHHSKVPNLVLNATCLNSGRNWRFTSVEVGDPVLGYLRRDEVEVLLGFKLLAEQTADELAARLARAKDAAERQRIATVRWWRMSADERVNQAWDEWPGLALLAGAPDACQELLRAELGLLRAAKLEAWYLRRGPSYDPPVEGGLPKPERERRFRALANDMGPHLGSLANQADPDALAALMDAVMDLYYARSAGGISGRALRDFERITLGDAVAASACFPPVFPPFTILGLYDDRHVATLRLTDGGVFDNIGLTALLEDGCTHVIASDAGGLLEVQARTTAGRLGMMGRIVGILMDDVRRRQLETLREKRRVVEWVDRMREPQTASQGAEGPYPLEGVAFFHMLTPPDAGASGGVRIAPEVAEATGRIRTDLDAFGDTEIAALVDQGYQLADRFARRYLERFAPGSGWTPATREPMPRLAGPDRELRVLRVGAGRLFRALRLGAVWAWLLTIFLSVGAVLGTWKVRLSLLDAARALTVALERAPIFTDRPVSVGAFVAVVALLAVAVMAWRKLTRRVRGLAWLTKWLTALSGIVLWLLVGPPLLLALVTSPSGNVLWLLLGLPVLLALVTSAIALVSYAYGREFLRVTRVPRSS